MKPDEQKHMIAGFACFGLGYVIGTLRPMAAKLFWLVTAVLLAGRTQKKAIPAA